MHAASAVRAMPQPRVANLSNKLPTPINIDKLRDYLSGYDQPKASFLIDGFSKGFRLGVSNASYSAAVPRNHASTFANPSVLHAKIKKEVALGRYVGPFPRPPFNKFVCSPLGLVPKKEPGQFRLIHDLSFPKGGSVNSAIPPENTRVSYQNIETVIDLVVKYGRHCLMAKADIEDAFRLLCINPDDYHFLVFSVDGKFYYDRSLAMGVASACKSFECFSTAIQWILNSKCLIPGISHLLDDFFFVGKAGTNQCSHALSTFSKVCSDINIPIKNEKTVLPTTVITIYGIEIDSVQMIARLPTDKLTKIDMQLSQFKRKRSVTLKELQSLIGLLNFACAVIIPGRAFLRRLQNLTIGHTCPSYRISLNSDARADLRAWHSFIKEFNGKSCFLFEKWLSSDSIKLYSDAAGVHGGYAAVLGSKWFYGEWPQSMESLHITTKELFPIVLALELWGHLLANHKILFFSDNAAVVDIINKTSCKDVKTMSLVRRLVLASLKYNVYFRAKHIPGKHNVICDLLSRFYLQKARVLAPWLDKEASIVPPHLTCI